MDSINSKRERVSISLLKPDMRPVKTVYVLKRQMYVLKHYQTYVLKRKTYVLKPHAASFNANHSNF